MTIMSTINDETIIAPATIPGTGAISLLRMSGPRALEICDCLVEFKGGRTAASSEGNRVRFGIIKDVDEVLVCIYKAPHSYTGEDSVEIMCHASAYIAGRIIELAIMQGARLAMPGEFTQRAYLNGKMDLTQAEAVADVIASTTEASHRVAMNQLKGGFSGELKELRSQLLHMASLVELELDFSEEDVEFANREQLSALLDKTIRHINRLADSFKLGNAIKNGVPVAIVGPTNAGKSTLLNAILGEQRAIVSDIEGTTRDTIEECFNVGGILFRFVDTAGIRKDAGEIEKIGIERSFRSIASAEIVILMLDAVTLSNASSISEGLAQQNISSVLETVDLDSQKLIVALNKCDDAALTPEIADNIFVNIKNNIVTCIDNSDSYDVGTGLNIEFCQISAKTGHGVEVLLEVLGKYERDRMSGIGQNTVLVTNIRHWQALVTASQSLTEVRRGIDLFSPTDLLAEDLRAALSTLGSITGEITHTDVLQNIFKNFCIGK